MAFEDRPQLPLTARRKVLVAAGGVMFAAQITAAALLAERTTGADDGDAVTFTIMWGASVLWSVVCVLCLVRQADIADVFTAALLVVVAPFALYALLGALALRGTDEDTDVVSAMFLGITAGALTAVLVWGMAMFTARVLRLPTTSDDGTPPEP